MTDDIEISERIERIIWAGVGIKSARQLSEETGLPPERILAIKRDLLDSVDVLTVQQRRQRLVVELERLAQVAREAADNASDERNIAGLLNASRGAMKDLLTEFRKTSASEQDQVKTLNEMRVKELLRLVDTTVARTLGEISSRYDLDEAELLSIFQSHLKPAADELEP